MPVFFLTEISAIVYAFNVSTLKDAEESARQNKITIKQHNIIYRLIDDIREEMNNSLPPVEVEDVQGNLICIRLNFWVIHSHWF